MSFLSLLGIITVIYVFLRFLNNLGKTIPIIELMLLIAGLQWIIGPVIEYNLQFNHYKYFMYVSESIYMTYVVPAYICFVLGAKLTNKKTEKFFMVFKSVIFNHKFAFVLIIMGLFSGLVIDFVPNSLRFLFHLISQLKFVGVIMLLFTEFRQKKVVLALSLIILLINAVLSAMFHTFILWSVFIFMYWCFKFPMKKWKIVITMVVGLSIMSILQNVKSAYRAEVWQNFNGNKIELFASLIYDSLMSNSATDTEALGEINVRLNQGWIISAIMNNFNSSRQYLRGETFLNSIESSLLPRFMNPNKSLANGQEYFIKMTGLTLGSNTSMGVSIIGESYGNFGIIGGIFFMIFYGLLISFTYKSFVKNSLSSVQLFFMLPIVFLPIIKAESDSLSIFNYLFKSVIFTLIVIKLIQVSNAKITISRI